MIRLWLLIILFQGENYRYKLNLGFGLLIGFLVVCKGAKVLKFRLSSVWQEVQYDFAVFKIGKFPILGSQTILIFFLSYTLEVTGAKSKVYLVTTVITITNVFCWLFRKHLSVKKQIVAPLRKRDWFRTFELRNKTLPTTHFGIFEIRKFSIWFSKNALYNNFLCRDNPAFSLPCALRYLLNFLINTKFEVTLEYNQHTRVCYVSRGLNRVRRSLRQWPFFTRSSWKT